MVYILHINRESIVNAGPITYFLRLSLVVAIILSNSAAFGYDVIDVEHGGVVEGTVTLEGAVPEPKGFNLITFPDPQYCGRISNGRGWRLLHDFVVGPNGWPEGCDRAARRRRGRQTL